MSDSKPKRIVLNLGEKFGRLTVVGDPIRRRATVYPVRCECGVIKEVAGHRLVSGHTKTCGSIGCRVHVLKHGHTQSGPTPEYRAWISMVGRCECDSASHFSHYGGRGISVCAKWRESFENFLSDMGNRPSPVHSLERKDVNGNYSPDNCRWATKREQGRNRRTTRWVTYDGETLSLADWADRTGIDYDALRWRLDAGWPIDRAMDKEAA